MMYPNGHVWHLPPALAPLYRLPEAREVLAMMPICDGWGLILEGQRDPRKNPFCVWMDAGFDIPPEPYRAH